MWKKFAKGAQYIGLAISIGGILSAAITLGFGEIIRAESINCGIAGVIIGIGGTVWEDYVKQLGWKRYQKRICRYRERPTYIKKKSALKGR